MSSEELEVRLTKLEAQLKKLYRLCNKIRTHQLDPTGEKAAERSKNSWFNKPQKVTSELSSFLKLPKNDTISSSEVTKLLSAYVREKNLKNPDNKSEILLDTKLKKLLQPEKNAVITHLNIQKYISKHYVKDE
jgi:chromatin remodeling complex protein RSC6